MECTEEFANEEASDENFVGANASEVDFADEEPGDADAGDANAADEDEGEDTTPAPSDLPPASKKMSHLIVIMSPPDAPLRFVCCLGVRIRTLPPPASAPEAEPVVEMQMIMHAYIWFDPHPREPGECMLLLARAFRAHLERGGRPAEAGETAPRDWEPEETPVVSAHERGLKMDMDAPWLLDV